MAQPPPIAPLNHKFQYIWQITGPRTHPSGSQDQAPGTAGMRQAGHGRGFWPHP